LNRYVYKVVPFLGNIDSSQNAGHVSAQLQSVINEHAKQGMEFHSMGEVSIQIHQGCLAGLFGNGTEYAKYDQLIFKRQLTDEEERVVR